MFPTESLGLVREILMYGNSSNVRVMTYGEERPIRSQFRDGSVSFQLMPRARSLVHYDLQKERKKKMRFIWTGAIARYITIPVQMVK